jgi:hypothetical protein
LCLCRLLSTADFSPPPAPRDAKEALEARAPAAPQRRRQHQATARGHCWHGPCGRGRGRGRAGPGWRAGEGESTAFICLNLDIEFFFSLSHIILNRRMTQKKSDVVLMRAVR